MPGNGLQDVIAASTSLSDIDGNLGRLWYVGYDIADLARLSTFEEIVYLLHYLELPSRSQLDEIKTQLARERELDEFTKKLIPALADNSSPMSMLRTMVSASSAYDPEGWEPTGRPDVSLRKAMRLVARTPTMIAYFHRQRTGQELIPPQPNLSHAENFLTMLTGAKPPDEDVGDLDVCLILHADHTMNASTFAARVAAGTLADIYSAMTAAIATLKGPLHGGANEEVMAMLESLDDVDQIPQFISDKLSRKEKIMGFGHRVYKVEDPRAPILREMARRLSERKNDSHWFDLSIKIDEFVRQEKNLYPNVDFYAASVYRYLGIPTDLYTTVFAASRMAGWTAHAREQYANNKLIRPDSEYIGPSARSYASIDER